MSKEKTVESVEEIRTRVDADLTELAERFGELQSRVEGAGSRFEEHVTLNAPEALVLALRNGLENIDNEVYAVYAVLEDYEQSNLDLRAALEDEANG